MAPSKVRVFHTRIEYNGLGRWKRKKDGPNQGRPFQLFSRTSVRNFERIYPRFQGCNRV